MQSFAGYTLFLDRDGVLNRRIVDDYVLKPEQFVIIDGVLDALKVFSNIFDHIVVVTNQQFQTMRMKCQAKICWRIMSMH